MSELVVMQFDGQDGSRAPAIRPRCWCNSGSSNPVACRWAPRRIVHGLVTNVRRRRSQSAAGVCHPSRAGDGLAGGMARQDRSRPTPCLELQKGFFHCERKGCKSGHLAGFCASGNGAARGIQQCLPIHWQLRVRFGAALDSSSAFFQSPWPSPAVAAAVRTTTGPASSRRPSPSPSFSRTSRLRNRR